MIFCRLLDNHWTITVIEEADIESVNFTQAGMEVQGRIKKKRKECCRCGRPM